MPYQKYRLRVNPMNISLDLTNLINVIFIAMGLGICTMSILQVGTGIHINNEVKKYFQVFFTLINVYISMHLFRMLFENHTEIEFTIGIRVVTFAETSMTSS